LYSVNTITRTAVAITEPATNGAWFDPVLLPAPARIAFVYSGAAPANQVFVSSADGSGRQKIADTELLYGLDWAPNGSQLLGVSTAGTERGLFIVRVRDGAVRKLAAPPVYAATWGP
jgi:Tol biopolymer transport system component